MGLHGSTCCCSPPPPCSGEGCSSNDGVPLEDFLEARASESTGETGGSDGTGISGMTLTSEGGSCADEDETKGGVADGPGAIGRL